MAEFSWSDRFTAFTSCLPCLSDLPCLPTSHTGPIRLPADAPDTERDAERSLRGLLAEESGTTDADTLSLHSTVGTDGRKKKKSAGRARNVLRRQPQRMSIMGVALFGRPIHEGSSDSADPTTPDLERPSRVNSDAQPLDDALLDRLARGGIDDQRFSRPPAGGRRRSNSYMSDLASPRDSAFTDGPDTEDMDEEELRQRAERRARRKERKAMKQAALALAMDAQVDPNGTFEGFQGSGSSHGAIPSPFRKSVPPPSESHSSGSGSGSGPRSRRLVLKDEDVVEVDEHVDADFDANSYARARPRSAGGSAGGSSASRSVGSAEPITDIPKPRRSKSGRSKSSRTKSSKTSSGTGSSATVASPLSAGFSAQDVHVVAAEPAEWAHPIETGSRFPSAGLPSTGLGGLRRKTSDAGAFLATRGDD
jgi:hypothetical protein